MSGVIEIAWEKRTELGQAAAENGEVVFEKRPEGFQVARCCINSVSLGFSSIR